MLGSATLTAWALLPSAARAAEAAAPPPPSPSAAAAVTAPPALDIWEFAVDGNSVLSAAEIIKTLEPFLGLDRTPDDVDRARAALERHYRDRGYKTVSVAIPKQTVRDGVVVLEVTESRVGRLNVVGSEYHSLDQIKAEAPALAEGTVPDFNQVSSDIAALNQQADRRVTPSLKAGATPNTVDVDLVVDDDLPLHGSLELNNRRSQDTSNLRAVASLSYDNLFQRGHSLSASVQTSPENTDDAKVFFGSYLARFGASRFNLLVNGLVSDSNIATVGGINVLGRGQTLGVRGIWTLPGTEELYQSLSVGLDYKNFKNTTVLGGSEIPTPITYYPLSAAYSSILRQNEYIAQLDLSLSFNSGQFGSRSDEFDVNRFGARGQQFWLRGSFAQTFGLPLALQGYIKLAGQLTDQPLISNEQISAGGADTVRGYLEASALGDYGITSTMELRSPPLAGYLDISDSFRPVETLRAYAFADSAVLRVRQPIADTPADLRLASFGFGFDFKLLSHLSGSLDWANPITSRPTTRAGNSRLLFRVLGSF